MHRLLRPLDRDTPRTPHPVLHALQSLLCCLSALLSLLCCLCCLCCLWAVSGLSILSLLPLLPLLHLLSLGCLYCLCCGPSVQHRWDTVRFWSSFCSGEVVVRQYCGRVGLFYTLITLSSPRHLSKQSTKQSTTQSPGKVGERRGHTKASTPSRGEHACCPALDQPEGMERGC